jgi:hypothetical protein
MVRIGQNIAFSLILVPASTPGLRGLLPLEFIYVCCRNIGKKIRSNTIFCPIPGGVGGVL